MDTLGKALVEGLTVLVVVAAVAAGIYHYFKRLRGIQKRLFRFLGIRKQEELMLTEGARCDRFLEVDLHRAMRDLLPTLGVQVEVVGMHGATIQFPAPPGLEISLHAILSGYFDGGMTGHESFSVGPDRKETFVTPALHLVSGGPFPLLFFPSSTPLYAPKQEAFLSVATVKDPAAQVWVQSILDQITAWMKKNSVYRGHFVSLDVEGSMALEFAPGNDEGTIVLEEELRRELDENFLTFLRDSEHFEAAGVSSKRGLLLCGEPGTGKTTTCRYLKQALPDHTVILADSKSCLYYRRLFELARNLEPAIVVIEDVDLMMPSRESMVNTGPLRDLLNEMDGPQRNGRLSVVMTSNSWQFLDVALADRPGRIDHVMVFERPGTLHRRALLDKLLEKCGGEIDFEALVKTTNGLTPAQLTEMVKKAMVSSLARRGLHEGRIFLEMEDFRTACERVSSGGLPTKLKRRIGLKQLPA